jgi:hypothetical protein
MAMYSHHSVIFTFAMYHFELTQTLVPTQSWILDLGLRFGLWTIKCTYVLVSGIRNTEYGIRNTEYGIRNTEYGIRNTEYGIRNTEYGIRNTEYGIRNTVNCRLLTVSHGRRVIPLGII